ncbi:hypothetical protein Tco_0903150, partial [Tanacetum coccineum]
MSEAFTNPLKLLHSENLARDDDETAEINHRSHPDHPLILNVEEAQSNSIIPNFNSREPIEFSNLVPKKYLPIVAPIEQYYDLETMSFEEAVGRVKAYEERLQSLEAKDEEQDSISLAQDDDNDHDDDVSTLSHTINDPFLTRLCYDNMDDNVVEQVDSDENMSANEEDEDSDGVEKYIERCVSYPSYDPSINWKLTKPILGMMYESCKQLKESMIDYGVANGYQLVFPVNDYKRLLVRCGKEEIDYEDDGVGNNDEKVEIGVGNNDEKEEDGGENNDEKEADGGENNDENGEDGVENNDEKGRMVSKTTMKKERMVSKTTMKKERMMSKIIMKKMGILEVVKDIVPYAEHRQCTRHIYANFKKKFRGIQFRNLFWAAAYSTTEQHFEDKMKELKDINNDAYNHLIERNPKSWPRAFFEVNRACNAFENDISESFNSRIRIARRKPIITMLEEIRIYVMLRNFKKAEKAVKLEHEVCPSIRKILEEIKVKQRHWSVIPSNYNVFEARNEYGSFVMDIQARTCSCRSWQLSGIPCVHTVAALAFLNKDPKTY